MSAFLGPIHSLMYQRVKNVHQIVNELAAFADEQDWGVSREDYVVNEFAPIEEVIDLSNIHDSLSGMVNHAEETYAAAIAMLLKEHPERLPMIENKLRQIGAATPIGGDLSGEQVCYRLQDILLDGMPCDRASEITLDENGNVQIVRRVDLHSGYFEAVGLDGALYEQLLQCYIEGLLS